MVPCANQTNPSLNAEGLNKPMGYIGRETFPLPTLSSTLKGFAHELYSGRGFFVLRTIPIEKYSRGDLAILYAGIYPIYPLPGPSATYTFPQVYHLTSAPRGGSKMALVPSSHTSRTSVSAMRTRRAASGTRRTPRMGRSSIPTLGTSSR